MLTNKLDYALALADFGFLFPLPPGEKGPFKGESWVGYMTRDKAQIAEWFKRNPRINYGFCPGDDCVVIDHDVKDGKNGILAFRAIEDEQPEAARVTGRTFTVVSPSEGRHTY